MLWLLTILVLPYFFILMGIFRSLVLIKQFLPDNSEKIFVSVIVPCRDESENIGILLRDISLQNYPSGLFEVIVVDDNSEDNTYETAACFSGIRNLKILKSREPGKKQALTAGINASSGELIITTDADCRIGQKWISTIVSFYNKLHKPDMIICPVALESRPGFTGKFQELEFLSLQGVTAGTAISGMPSMCNGANLAFTSEVFRIHSGNLHYETASGDDVFLLHSLKKEKGSEIVWLESPDSLVIASSSGTMASFLKQRKRWVSKSRYYKDKFTILLAVVTFVTTTLQIALLSVAIFRPEFFPQFLTVLALKSIPDFLILQNTTKRYGRKELMKWFLPSQLIYPFYVLGVILFPSKVWKRPGNV